MSSNGAETYAKAGELYPICLKAKRACPPEDCGGVGGYMHFLEAIRDPSHPEHQDMLTWVGGYFDSEDSEFDEINFSLRMVYDKIAKNSE